MKNKIFIYLFTILTSASALAQKQTRAVDPFTKLSFGISGNLYLRQGTPQKVEIEASKESLEKIVTEVSGGQLKIKTDRKWNNWNWHNEDIKIYVTVEHIEEIQVNGSGDLVVQTPLTGKDFNFDVSGSGSLETDNISASGNISADVSGSGGARLKGNCVNFESTISGSGDVSVDATMSGNASFHLSGSGKIKASGSARQARASTTGSGEIQAANFVVDSCDVDITGSGDVEINVKSSLDARITGSGSVSYKGNPAHVNSHSTGSGHVHKM